MGAVITLTTDFGLSDAYVATVKGVILGINPEARLVDICHNVKPQNISQAAFVLSTAYRFFSQKTVHLVVVDPGVGTERRAVILRTPAADFVAPDNGVLSYVIRDFLSVSAADGDGPRQVELTSGLEGVAITKSQFWRNPVSSTFHGRDIFAPVAAMLSLGFPPVDFGEAINSLTVLPVPQPYQRPDGSLLGHVLHIDNFGNLITDIKENDLPPGKEPVTIGVGNQEVSELSRTYSEGKGLIALIGSSGYLEISLRGGSAGAFLDAEVGNDVRLKRISGAGE
ncbi:S-adenosyl-l-methionine hydroxide adenosyltransferase family protein [Chloroflexota bacterium]